MAKKKIAIITPLLTQGGLEKVAANLSLELIKYYDVYLIVFDAKKLDYKYGGELIDLGINLNNRDMLKRFIYSLKVIKQLFRLKKFLNLDAVISMGEITNIPNILSGGNNNILTIHENRFNAKNDLQRKIVNLLAKFLYKTNSIKKIVTVSKDIKNDVMVKWNVPASKITTIYNPLDINDIRAKSNEDLGLYANLFSKNKILINVGRLTYQKGQWFLLRIFKELKKYLKDYKLVILGDGEVRDELISLSKKLGLKIFSVWEKKNFSSDYDVYFLGFQNNPFKFVKNSYVFISTSLWEGLSNAIIEALACKQAVIHSNCKSGPLEILSPENINSNMKLNKNIIYGKYGILLPTFNKIFLTDGQPLTKTERLWVSFLRKILSDNKIILKYKNISLERAFDFDIVKIGEQWKQLIES